MTNKSLPRIVLVGLPNVGKSSVLNRLLRRRQAIVAVEAHTTRDTAAHQVEIADRWADLQDTPGLSIEKDELSLAAMEQLAKAWQAADVVLFVVDATTKPTAAERSLAQQLHKAGRNVIVVANQADRAGASPENFRALGFADIFAVSAIHTDGFAQLTEKLAEYLPRSSLKPVKEQIRVGIFGRPNVGKSSLFNALAGDDLALVSSIGGTTRDPVVREAQADQPWRLVDTAGIRRPGKIERGMEFFSYNRAQKVMNEVDICLLVLDASDGATGQDQRLLGLISEAGKALIVVVNKIDEVDSVDQPRVLNRMQKEFAFARWVEAVPVSAKTGDGLATLQKAIAELAGRLELKLPTPELNRLLAEVKAKHPPTSARNLRPKLNYMVQTGMNPFQLTIFGAHTEAIHFSYRRFIENSLRAHYDLRGMPVQIVYASKYKPEEIHDSN